jgi:DNA-binding transcriptional LysR family regulator
MKKLYVGGDTMNQAQIRFFMEIVQNDVSFSRTAKSLCISQPTLSKRIKKISEELEVQLFETSRRSAVKLTPGGEILYNFFAEYSDKLQKTIYECKKLNDQPFGTVRIAIFPGWGEFLLQKINNFLLKYPNIALSLESVSYKAIKIGILNNYYDLAITTEEQFKDAHNIGIKNIVNIFWILLYSKNHRLAQKDELSIIDFKDETLYTLSLNEMPWLHTVYESYCKSKGFVPKIKTFSNLESIYLALDSGRGYAILDQWVRVKQNSVYKYFELDKYLTVSAVWKNENHNPALNIFLENCLL